jgi:hypothetical protein
MVRSRLQLPSLDIGPSHKVRRWEPRKPHGSVLQLASARGGLAKSGGRRAGVGLARRSETDAGRGDRRGQHSTGHAAAQESSLLGVC